MSLLLEALKKAEKAKREKIPGASDGDVSGRTSAPGHGLTLELEVPSATSTPDGKSESPLTSSIAETGMSPTNDGAQTFPEISLDDLEPPELPPAQLETAQAENIALEPALSALENEPKLKAKTEPVLSLVFPEPAAQPALPATEPVSPIAEASQAGMGDLSPNSQKSEQPRLDTAPVALEPRPAEQQTAPAPILEYSAPQPPTPSPKAAVEAGQAGMGGVPPNSQANLAGMGGVPPNSQVGQAGMGDKSPNSHKTPNQETAKKILAAKQDRPKRNLKLLGGILIGSMTVGAAAAYYYWQAVSQPAIAFRPPPQAAMPSAMTAPAPQPLPAQPVEPVAAVSLPASAQPHEAEISAGEAKTGVAPPQAAPIGATPLQKPERKKTASAGEPDKAPTKPSAIANAGAPDGGIKIRRDADDAKLDPLLTGAYQAFMAGETGKAENDYRKVLQQSPDSRDALLGLAAIAASRGQREEAASHYLRLLQLDPRDAAAQAGLIGLRGFADPALSESRLKTLLAQYPEAGYLHFSLGNLYAHQSRWPEAQEAYFNAFHADSGNADYAFNLAVSLDHLGQHRPALVYYQRALVLVKGRSVGFDGEQLKKRIHELQLPD